MTRITLILKTQAETAIFGTPTATADGFTVQISNYSALYTWAGTATASGSVAISGSGLVTVTGVSGSTSSTATITTTRTGYVSSSATVTATSVSSFSAVAVALTSGTSYTVPTGATSMKAWAVGSGGLGDNSTTSGYAGNAGGCAYKTWTVTGGSSVAYTRSSAGNSTVTYGGTTITGNAAPLVSSNTPASFSGGDGGASGGLAATLTGGDHCGGAVGGNGTSVMPCRRQPATNISGLFAALTLAGVSTTETCAASAAFGSGGHDTKYGPAKTAGLGGGGVTANAQNILAGTPAGAGAVVLYFT